MKPVINPHIFRAYDIRGIAVPNTQCPQADLTAETINLIGKGAGIWLQRVQGAKNMLIGRDNRLHSEMLQKAFIKGVRSTGMKVIDIGLSTSPLIYYAVCRYGMDSGINITASHNPKEYNGVKIVGKNAHCVCGDELQAILKLIQTEDFLPAYAENRGLEPVDTSLAAVSKQRRHADKLPAINEKVIANPFNDYLENMKRRFKLARPLKVVVDAGNAVTGIFAPQLLRAIGCEVIELYCDLDGNYPNHEANPEDEANMRDLSATVIKNKADLGIGFDGDGDRVGIVDENGKHCSADYLLLLLARDLLGNKPGSSIVFDVKVSKILIDDIKKHSGIPIMGKTGHSFIEMKMRELNAPLGGETSGHMFFGKNFYDYYGFDDAFFATCKLLEVFSKFKGTFSGQFKNLPQMETTPEFKAYCPDDKKFAVVQKLTNYFTRKHHCITIDGVRVNFDEDAWGAVRCSNTSPNLTLRFEASTKEKLGKIQALIVKELKKYPEVDLSWYREMSNDQISNKF